MRDCQIFEQQFVILEDTLAVWAEFEKLARHFKFGGKQVHDAYIVASMLAHGETRILTANQADFRRFSNLIEIVALVGTE